MKMSFTKDFDGLAGGEDSKNRFDRVSERRIGFEFVADRCGLQVLDLEF